MIDIEKEEETTKIIDNLKEKVAQLEDIIGLLPGHVYWLDREHMILGCNGAEEMLGPFSSRKEIVGKLLYDIIKEKSPETEKVNNKIMEDGQPYMGEEIVQLSPGCEKVYLSHKIPLRNNRQEITGLVGMSLDITDRKRMEKELKLAKEAAELANEAKTEFIRNMEHDIRTPLCGIMNVVTYLQTVEQDNKKKEYLSDIQIATGELLNYLENIMEFSQITMGEVPLIYREFDLKQLIQSIVNLESAAIKDKRIELLVNYDEAIPKIVIGDRFRVQRILLNLISNAIKFTDVGEVHIYVNPFKKMHNEIWFEIKISDTGIGIDKKYHELIFEKFTRCDPSNKGIYKGKGLGLWIVKSFIKDLRGCIFLQSEIGKGSTFVCQLPFRIKN